MRILLISLYFPPDLGSTGVLMEQLTGELQAHGYEITVIAADPHYPDRAGAPARRKRWRPYWEHRPGLAMLRAPVPTFGNPESTVSRLATYAVFNALSFLAAVCAKRHDVVFAPSPPLTSGLFTALVGALRGVPSVYNVQDLVPEARGLNIDGLAARGMPFTGADYDMGQGRAERLAADLAARGRIRYRVVRGRREDRRPRARSVLLHSDERLCDDRRHHTGRGVRPRAAVSTRARAGHRRAAERAR